MARFNTQSITTSVTGAGTVASPQAFTALNGTAPYTVTLASPALFPGVNQQFYNATGGTVTLSTPSGNFVGTGGSAATTIPVYAGNVVSVTADGTNYIVISEDGSALTATSATISGTLTVQSTGGVAIAPSTTGTIDNVNIGATTRGSGAFNTLTSNNAVTFTAGTASSTTGTGTVVITGGLGVSGTINAASVSASLTGTIQTASQTNITAVGTLTSLAVSGAASASAGSIQVTSTDPTLRLKWTATPVADKNTWEIRSIGNGTTPYLQFRTINDANTVFTDRVAFTNDGNVGIGTATPGSLLEIASGAPTFILNANTQAVNVKKIRLASSNNTAGDFVVSAINDDNSLKNYMLYVSNAGNVGIGTTNPTAKLHVKGTAGNADPFINFEVVSPNSTFNWVSQSMASNLTGGNNLAHFIGKASSTKNSAYFAYKHSSDGSNDNILTLGLYGVDNVLNINGLANVGIGTTSPSTKLHVAGALTVNGSASFYSLGSFNTGTSQWVLLGRFTGGSLGETLNLHFYGATGYNGTVNQHSRTFIQIRNGNGNPADTNVSVDYHTEGQSIMVLDVRVQNVNGIAYGTTWDVYVQINSVCGNAYYIPFINSGATWSHTGTGAVGAPTVSSTVISGTNLFMMNSTSYFANSVGIGTTNPNARLSLIDEDGGQPMIQMRNFNTNSAGVFDGTFATELRSASTGATMHGAKIHLHESNNDRRTLDVSDLGGIIASFVNGKVGIGTTGPGTKLHVVVATPTSVAGAPAGTSVLVDSNTNNFVTVRSTADNATNSGILMQDNNVGGYLIFRNYDSGNASISDRMFLSGYQGVNISYGSSDGTDVTLRTTIAKFDSGGLTVNDFNFNLGTEFQSISRGYSAPGSGPREIFRVPHSNLCTNGIFSVSATRGGYVHSSMWSWSTTHNGAGQGTLTMLSSGNYTNMTAYLDVDGAGGGLISVDWGSSQYYIITVLKMSGGTISFASNGSDWSSPESGRTRYSKSTISNGFKAQNGVFDGSLSKGSGSFKIEHPLPELAETHDLVHSFIEGPKADLIYRGKVALVAGRAEVNIDTASTMTEGTFELLCRDVQCFTTNETDWSPVRGSVTGNILTIECQSLTSTATISWMVIGERKDKHMYDTEWTDSSGRPIVEPLKNPVQTDFPPYPENVNTNTEEEDHGTI